ncbi:MAG: gamma carbonic anhydrase family protein [Raoultibacter sp.]|jgi:carbonic anhydrase/acetyltransferase-like protein (isoleucine patch superfamily)
MTHDIATFDYHQVQADPSARISPNASIIGKVTLEARSSIFTGVSIRADSEPAVIGEDTNIQEGALLHDDIGYPIRIGKGVTVGHGAILHGCEIGDNCIIGMGAIIMNGARVGKNSIVAAGALISEGKSFEDNALVVGMPAKLRSVYPEEEIAQRCKRSADIYLQKSARMLEAGILKNPESKTTIYIGQ